MQKDCSILNASMVFGYKNCNPTQWFVLACNQRVGWQVECWCKTKAALLQPRALSHSGLQELIGEGRSFGCQSPGRKHRLQDGSDVAWNKSTRLELKSSSSGSMSTAYDSISFPGWLSVLFGYQVQRGFKERFRYSSINHFSLSGNLHVIFDIDDFFGFVHKKIEKAQHCLCDWLRGGINE